MSLEAHGYLVHQKPDANALKEALAGPQPDVVLLDLKLSKGDELKSEGLDLLPQVKKAWPDTEVVVLTGHPTLDAAVEATKLGAFHFQKKPHDDGLFNLVRRALELKDANHKVREELIETRGVFASAPMKDVVRTVERIAPSDVSILITGESGSGKEVVADLVHALSPRKKGPFVKVNCAALPRELIESELFGSVKGAFTGAQADREGLFRQAESGTLLLDELSEMPIDTQSKLLRVLQEKEVRPVGGRTSYKTDCRVIAATNRQVEQAIKEGKLREDLYYRISAITIALPALRDRRDDILPLASAFLRRFASQADRPIEGFSPAAAELLRKYDWPGNIRQLQNEVQRAVLMCDSHAIDVQDLSIDQKKIDSEADEQNLTLMEAMERSKIIEVLNETRGNKLETARRLGIGRQTLYNKIKAYAITV
jgi:DNA-binding NtrC family response regulator